MCNKQIKAVATGVHVSNLVDSGLIIILAHIIFVLSKYKENVHLCTKKDDFLTADLSPCNC